jgi:hypothetical protein
MNQRQLDLHGLADLDNGLLNAAFQQELANAISDVHDRPGVDKPRVITLTVAITPFMDQKGNTSEADMKARFSSTVPKRESVEYRMLLAKNTLLFQEASPENPHQNGLPFNPTSQK